MKNLIFSILVSIVLFSCTHSDNENDNISPILPEESETVEKKFGWVGCISAGTIGNTSEFNQPNGSPWNSLPYDFGEDHPSRRTYWGNNYINTSGGIDNTACLHFTDDWVYRQGPACYNFHSNTQFRASVWEKETSGAGGILYVVFYGDDGSQTTLKTVTRTNPDASEWEELDTGWLDITKDGYIRAYIEVQHENKKARFDSFAVFMRVF